MVSQCWNGHCTKLESTFIAFSLPKLKLKNSEKLDIRLFSPYPLLNKSKCFQTANPKVIYKISAIFQLLVMLSLLSMQVAQFCNIFFIERWCRKSVSSSFIYASLNALAYHVICMINIPRYDAIDDYQGKIQFGC